MVLLLYISKVPGRVLPITLYGGKVSSSHIRALWAGQAESALCPHVVLLCLGLPHVCPALEQHVRLGLLVDGGETVLALSTCSSFKLRTSQGQH